MTTAHKKRLTNEWDKELEKVKNTYFKDEARKLYAERKIEDGEIFWVKGAFIKIKDSSIEKEAVVLAMIVYGKFVYVKLSAQDRRLNRLKRNAIANLMNIWKTKMVNTRQVPWVPHQYQSIKNPDFTLYGADSADDDFEGKKFKKEKQIFDEDELLLA